MSMRNRLALLALASLPWSGGAAAAATYDVTLLPSLGGTSSSASDINDAGQIVGSSKLLGDAASHAAFWTAGGPAIDLAPNAGVSAGDRINNHGQIIGHIYSNPLDAGTYGAGQTLLWQSASSTPTLLAPLAGSVTSQASGINNSGKIAGTSFESSNTVYAPHATVWSPATSIDTTQERTLAYDVNNAGVVVGTAFGSNGENAVIWSGSQRRSLPNLAGATAVSGLRINDEGLIIGTTFISGPSAHDPFLDHNQATVWDGSAAAALPSLGGLDSVAIGLNNLGQVVGWSSNVAGGAHATLWNGTAPVDLNSFMSSSQRSAGWTLLEATAINNLGWIVGDAVNRATGQDSAFLLSVAVVPEPATQGLMLMGVALISIAARRKGSAIRQPRVSEA